MNVQKIIYPLIIVWSLLAGYFAFSDLQISNGIVNTNADWAVFLGWYGELPGTIVVLFSLIIYIANYKANSLVKKISVLIFLEIAVAFVLIYIVFVILWRVTSSQDFFFNNLFFLVVASLFFTLIVIITLKKIILNFPPFVILTSKVIIFMSFTGYLIFIQLGKIFWGRLRFRELNYLQSDFTEWYLPQGISGSESFPSGHAAMAWMLLPIILLIPKKNKIVKIITTALIVAWGIAVPLSRIVIGAHFASDVLFGSFIIIISFLFFANKYLSSNLYI
ncbi:MAG: phosphatase PAP2 family protein [Ignavibacteriaceae bacterium]|nr:phosphatase PAP2 family protein [Ignavibacteriaceae bacterium]